VSDRARILTIMSSLRKVRRSVVLGIAVDPDTARLIRQRAAAADRSVSSEIRRQLMLAGYLKPTKPTTRRQDDEPIDDHA
jgi:hypothetical protein